MRGVDVLTAQEDGRSEATDPELLDRATALQRVLFTQDDDLLTEAVKRQQAGVPFRSVAYAHQLRVSIGECIQGLEYIAQAGTETDAVQHVFFLPF